MRYLSLILLFSILFTAPAMSQSDPFFDLNDYRWKNRILLIFSPTSSNSVYRNQMKALKGEKAAEGLRERSLLIFRVIEQRGPFLKDLKIPEDQYSDLRKRFNADSRNYAMILIGKDGSEKERYRSAVGLDGIFERIDEMPMRKLEIDGKKN